MMSVWSRTGVFTVVSVALLVAWLSTGHGQLSCDRGSGPCSCEGTNFSKIDVSLVLENSVNRPIRDPDHPGTTWYLVNFCSGTTCIPEDQDGNNAVACQQQTSGQTNVSVKLGDISDPGPSWQVFGNNTFTVRFDNGDITGDGAQRSAVLYIYVLNRTSSIVFNEVAYVEQRVENPDIPDPTTSVQVYVFSLYLAVDGNKSEGPARFVGIIGIVVIFVFLLAILAYFIIGGILMYTVKGARGIEVIPQYTFWKALPGYIKDGYLFTVSPCMKITGQRKTGYQSL